ncbi:FACT complex subunit [Saitozyma podzolica]|uniref:FACT complex subunit POB3 n=1 Tax=Saitozyma podzolica TaxID=1890683 RepID=A0A427XYV4_9TREE|nr:FACT complex subunit [Saitozyma podzolica]
MSTVTFENVYHGESPDLGKLRFNAAGFGWKSYASEENEPVTYSGADAGHEAGDRRVGFDGFKREDHDKVKRTLDEFFNVKLETRDISLKGWNWGKADVQGNEIAFQVQGRPSFEIPLSWVANSNIAGKNEVALEFNPPPKINGSGGATARAPDELVEMRFYVPGKSVKKGGEGGDEGEDAEDEEVEVDEDGNEVSAAEAMHNLIKERADIGQVVGDSIVVFEDVLVLTPRGRFSLEFFQDSLRLVGKSTDYRVPFTSIHRIFLLPKVDDLHVQLVLGLDPPIRQGATRYPFLVAQWPKDEEVDAELNLSDEDIARFPDLQRKYEAPTFQVISRVLKSLTGKRVTPPGSFRNAQGLQGIKANVKATQGELYFLDKGLIFIAKQPILIDFSKTESISFSRVGGGIASAKTFDMRVVSKSEVADHVFSAISKEEVAPISAFLTSKNVRLKNEMDDEVAALIDVDDVDMGSDEDDEDASIESEDDKRGKKGKGKGKGADKARVKAAADDDDDESGEWGDFDAARVCSTKSAVVCIRHQASGESGAASDASDPMMEEIRRRAAGKKKKGKEESDSEGKPKKKKAKTDED